jgi:hypothetical protein
MGWEVGNPVSWWNRFFLKVWGENPVIMGSWNPGVGYISSGSGMSKKHIIWAFIHSWQHFPTALHMVWPHRCLIDAQLVVTGLWGFTVVPPACRRVYLCKFHTLMCCCLAHFLITLSGWPWLIATHWRVRFDLSYLGLDVQGISSPRGPLMLNDLRTFGRFSQ